MKKRTLNISFLLLLLSLVWHFPVGAQLSEGGIPPSFRHELSREEAGRTIVKPPDMTPFYREDSIFPSPYRFGIILPVDIEPDMAGKWTTLPDGQVIWRATVTAPGALALSAYFDRFHIPEGGKLFIYNRSGEMVAGAFTARNNTDDGLFSSQLFYGDEITLEYVQSSGSTLKPELHLSEITYAYRGVGYPEKFDENDSRSGFCEVNVNCPEGYPWQDQKRGVLKIHVRRAGGTYWCSGSLINNTREDNSPYVLTANHCGFNSTVEELLQWVFYFDYETQECEFTGYPKPKTMTGAVLLANSGEGLTAGSDFYLIKLSENIPDTFNVFFNGWSRSDDYISPSGVCIHHPGGDLKKVSTYTKPLTSSTWMGSPEQTHWKVYWSATQSGHGVTEGGSSGSPIFDNRGRIVGFLSGGESACDSLHINLPDYFGKFSWAWSSDGDDSTNTLMYWLDPDSTNLMVLDGRYTDSIGKIVLPEQEIFPNPFTDKVTVSMTDVSHTGVRVTVYDISGRIAYTGDFYINGIGSFSVPLGFLNSGLYLIRFDAGEVSFIRKIIRK